MDSDSGAPVAPGTNAANVHYARPAGDDDETTAKKKKKRTDEESQARELSEGFDVDRSDWYSPGGFLGKEF